jgi:hypothetical protein
MNKTRLFHYLRKKLSDTFNCIYQYTYIGLTTAEETWAIIERYNP